MDSELKQFEEELGRVAPEALPEGLISRMEAAMDGWQEAEREEKVVPFPVQEEGAAGGGFWKAVAAVAMLGAAVALMVPSNREGIAEVVAATSHTSPVAPAYAVDKVAPHSFETISAERNVVRADNQGVVVMAGGSPHRCVRVEYVERYEIGGGENGQALHVSKPAVDFILIPIQPD